LKHTIYNTSTGVIQRQIQCNAFSLPYNIQSGESAIEGEYKAPYYKIIEGSAVAQSVTFDPIAYLRPSRNDILTRTDWTQAADSPLSDSKKAEWATYRQALRDMTTTQASKTEANKIIYPTPPE